MRYKALFWTLPLLAPLLLVAAPAEAGHDAFQFGAGFRIGDVHFRVGYAEGAPYGPSYYFEAGRPLGYRGYGCTDHCAYRSGRHYHHPSCPLVRHHFARYGYAPDYLLVQYGPPIVRRYADPWVLYGPPRHGYPPFDRHYSQRWYRPVPPGHYKHHHKHHRERYRYDSCRDHRH